MGHYSVIFARDSAGMLPHEFSDIIEKPSKIIHGGACRTAELPQQLGRIRTQIAFGVAQYLRCHPQGSLSVTGDLPDRLGR